MFKNYLKVAFRNILRYKTYSVINITGLSVGIAVSIFVILWVQDEWSFNRFHKNIDNIHQVISLLPVGWTSTSPWAISEVLKKDFPEIVKSTRYVEASFPAKYGDMQQIEKTALADKDFFSMFTFPFIKGDPQTAFDAANSAVITEEFAARFFPHENPIGKSLQINNQWECIITGIIKNVPVNSTMQFNILMHVKILPAEILQSWAIETEAYVLLGKNVSVSNLRNKIAGTTMKYDKRTNEKITNDLQPFSSIYLYSLEGAGRIVYIYIFSTAAFLILLLACINFINLSTARAGKRSTEIGIRKVVGAVRGRIIWQFLLESMLYAFLAFILAILLVLVFLPEFNMIAEKQLKFSLSQWQGAALLALVIVTGLISGFYPSLVLSSFKPINALKKSSGRSSSRAILKKFLVVFQFTIAVALTIGTLIIYRQLQYIRNKDLGFNKDFIVTIPTNPDLWQKYETVKNELKGYANILNVTSANNPPTQVGNINPVYWEGGGPQNYKTMNFVSTDFDYIETFDMKIVDGRNFSRDMETDKKNYLVNEEAVKFMKLENPVGKMFSIWTMEGIIIGIVKNFHATPLQNQIQPVVFTLNQNWQPSQIFVKIRPNNIPQTLDHIKSVWAKYVPTSPFTFEFLDEIFERQYNAEERMGTLFNYFAVLTIFVSCLGLLSLTAFIAEQRTKEIGVRKVLGASVRHIIFSLSKEFLLLLLIANIIAWPLMYYFMKQWLDGFAYHTDMNIAVFLFSSVLVSVMAIFTVSFQAFKAAQANPVESLKYE
jgi:putative ABC transport system permease protein